MYTQCPDCEIAFKVTAEVLKQAAGKVRCGGCGNAFNALAYLSEQMPKQPAQQTANDDVPELRPEIIETDSGLPRSISAEQSAALLKTLDELAGSDIRIEDTGVEWRVLDENEAATPAADDDDAGLDPQVENVDEYLDDNPTPIDEFLTATPEVIDSPEIFEQDNGPARSYVDELRFDDNTPLPDDFDLSDEEPDTPETASDDQLDTEDIEEDPVVEELQPDLALSEPDEWTDILGEFQELVEEVSAPLEVASIEDAEPKLEEIPVDEAEVDSIESTNSHPLDMDSQFALQAEAMGIELSDIHQVDEQLEFAEAAEFAEQLSATSEEALIEEPIVESHSIEDELAGDHVDGEDNELDEEPVDELANESSREHYVPPMTDEEHTVNMQIDQELMALAIEDEDGFASTMLIPDEDAERMVLEKSAAEDESEGESDSADVPDTNSGKFPVDDSLFETIIMEGESVRSPQDDENQTAHSAAAAEMAEIARAKEVEQAPQSSGPRYGMIAAGVALVLLLVGQLMHQSREALATNPAFSNTVGQLYRAIGQPVQPAWDITGWRFEATKGSTEGDEEELTVYSRLGNKSDAALPYPLIGISLTDRFEETIGSRMLDPAEYLAKDLDPRKLVEPGNTFNAVITIKSTTEDATGFKLNVCYRLSDGQLRCAIDDFK